LFTKMNVEGRTWGITTESGGKSSEFTKEEMENNN